MPLCEMCGKREDKLKDAVVEGTLLSVCSKCSNFGKVVILEKPKEDLNLVKKDLDLEQEKEVEVIIPEAHQIIKKERERKDLKHEDLAKLIAEKASSISTAESGKPIPLKLAKKLEQFFNIKLIAKHTEIKESPKKLDMSDPDLTIGDLIRYKSKKST